MKSLEQKYKHLRQNEIAKTETVESKSSIKLRRINYLEPFTSTSASSQDKGCKYKNKNKINAFQHFPKLQQQWGVLFGPTFLTLMVRGAHCALTFFRPLFLHEKRGLEVQNFLTFPNSLWTFRKSKIFFWFFTVFWGDLEGAGWFSAPPPALKQHPGAPLY